MRRLAWDSILQKGVVVLHVTKWVAAIAITLGGGLSGVMGGSSLGPVRLDLELPRSQLEWLGAGGGMILAFLGCCLATEYSKARERNRAYLEQMKRLAHFRFN
jgi:hypothetical protein